MFGAALFVIAKTWKQLKSHEVTGLRRYGVHTQWNII